MPRVKRDSAAGSITLPPYDASQRVLIQGNTILPPPDALAAAIDLVIRKAPALREAGVVSFELDGLSIRLREPEPAVGDPNAVRAEPTDPFQDPASFGGRIPGYGRPDGFDEE